MTTIQDVHDVLVSKDPFYLCRGICCDSCEDKPCTKNI